jgi:glycosyltransferase involved in cell wall biosynthesis
MRTNGRCYDVAFYLPTLGPLIDPRAAIPFAGGAETQIWLLARGLARRGYAICVVVKDTPDGLPAQIDGVDVVIRPPWEGGRGLRGRVAELRALWETLGPLQAKIVVQRAAGFSTGLVGAITRARRRTFVYSSAHVLDFDYGQLACSRRDLRLFHMGLRLANRIVVQTDEQADRCRTKFGRDPVVIRSVAEPAEISGTSPEVFLWIGRLVSYKQPAEFIALARALPEARFQMVGLGSGNEPELEELVRREAHGLPNIELLPTRPRGELLPLYERAVAVVNTSVWEGMPNTFLEGWGRGIPALALAHDPDHLIEREQIGGFAAGSRERFASLARHMWCTRHERDALTRRCCAYVLREHAPETVIDRWIDALGLSRHLAPAPAVAAVDDSSYAHAS